VSRGGRGACDGRGSLSRGSARGAALRQRRPREVTAETIKAFAAEFDPQPFHLDEAAAAASLFGGLAASGWHTAALTMRLLVDGGLPLAGGLIGASGELSWPRPTRPGDVLHVECTVERSRRRARGRTAAW
jgi:acyl dehydratase